MDTGPKMQSYCGLMVDPYLTFEIIWSVVGSLWHAEVIWNIFAKGTCHRNGSSWQATHRGQVFLYRQENEIKFILDFNMLRRWKFYERCYIVWGLVSLFSALQLWYRPFPCLIRTIYSWVVKKWLLCILKLNEQTSKQTTPQNFWSRQDEI